MTFESTSALTNTTKMSLDQRFTQLRSEMMRGRGLRRRMSISDFRAEDLRQQSSTAKSRRLALQMSQRPTVIAALNGGPPSRRGAFGGGNLRRGQFRGRGGRGIGLRTIGRDRRPISNFQGGNRLRRSSSVGRLQRSQSVGRLSRSQSLQSLNDLRAVSPSPFRTRGGRGRGRGGRGRPAGIDVGGGAFSGVRIGRVVKGRGQGRGGRGGRGFTPRRTDYFTPRGGGGGRGGRKGGFNQNRLQQGGIGRGRGAGGRGRGTGGRGRGGFRRGGGGGRGGRGGRQQQQPPPTKEKLDMELDEYMAATKANLDKEIDSYMSKTEEVWEV